METASHAWWFLRAPLDGIHVQGFRETPRDTFTFFLTGFRQRTENVTFASYNKGGSVKAVKKRFIGNSAIMQPYPQDVHHSTLL